MKKVLVLILILLGGAVHAAPLDELVELLNPLCEGELAGELFDELGGESLRGSLCNLRDLAKRGEGLVDSYEAGADEFLRQAFRDGFDLLGTYTELDTDLGNIEAFSGQIDALIRDGVSMEGALGFITRTAGAESIRELLGRSTAEAGSLEHTVEESRRLNPAVLSKELQTIETVAQTQEKSGEVTDVASGAMTQAVESFTRGDEGDLMLNMVDPSPINQGIAEEAVEKGEQAVSTRAAVQVLLDFEAKAAVARVTEMTSLISAVKESGLQEAQSTKAISMVARELYAQRMAEANEWRSESRRAVEEAYNEAQATAEAFAGTAAIFSSGAAAMGERTDGEP